MSSARNVLLGCPPDPALFCFINTGSKIFWDALAATDTLKKASLVQLFHILVDKAGEFCKVLSDQSKSSLAEAGRKYLPLLLMFRLLGQDVTLTLGQFLPREKQPKIRKKILGIFHRIRYDPDSESVALYVGHMGVSPLSIKDYGSEFRVICNPPLRTSAQIFK